MLKREAGQGPFAISMVAAWAVGGTYSRSGEWQLGRPDTAAFYPGPPATRVSVA